MDFVADALLAKEVGRMGDAATGAIAALQDISSRRRMPHRQDHEIIASAQQNDRFEPWEIAFIDLAAEVETAAFQGDGC